MNVDSVCTKAKHKEKRKKQNMELRKIRKKAYAMRTKREHVKSLEIHYHAMDALQVWGILLLQLLHNPTMNSLKHLHTICTQEPPQIMQQCQNVQKTARNDIQNDEKKLGRERSKPPPNDIIFMPSSLFCSLPAFMMASTITFVRFLALLPSVTCSNEPEKHWQSLKVPAYISMDTNPTLRV